MAARKRSKKTARGTKISVRIGGRDFLVTPQQKAEIDALPAGLKRNLRAPGRGKLMTKPELRKLKEAVSRYDTVMCPW